MSCKTVRNENFEDYKMKIRKDTEGIIGEWKEPVKNAEFLERAKGEYMTIKAPDYGLIEMQKRIEQAKADKRKHKKQRLIRYGGAAAAVMTLLLVVILVHSKRKSGVHSFFTR